MKPGDAVWMPCMDRLHWVEITIERVDEYRDRVWIANSRHECRGEDLILTHNLMEHQVRQGFTPDLPLPPFAWCDRCHIPLYQGRNLADTTMWLECCERTVFQCTTCIDEPWPRGGSPDDASRTYGEWLVQVHAPVCGRRCRDCNTRVTYALAWRCVGCGTAEQRACEPTRCDECFAKHRRSCTHQIWRNADHTCPYCQHRRVKYDGGERVCTWCKASWQAYYQNSTRFASDLEERR